jgi:hypothetical protein
LYDDLVVEAGSEMTDGIVPKAKFPGIKIYDTRMIALMEITCTVRLARLGFQPTAGVYMVSSHSWLLIDRTRRLVAFQSEQEWKQKN